VEEAYKQEKAGQHIFDLMSVGVGVSEADFQQNLIISYLAVMLL